MKRIIRENSQFDLMRLLNQQATKRGVSIHDATNHEGFLGGLASSFQTARTNEALIHGLRAQTMFGYVAAALGRCVLLKEEDAGEIYTQSPSMRAPDYRLVLEDGSEIFVEVKNHRPANGFADYVGTTAYLASLQDYAKLFKKELFFAFYWPVPKLWTLVNAGNFNVNGSEFRLSLTEAVTRNEMARLGDVLIATLPSLSLKLYSDPALPRRVAHNGKAEFTVGKAELYCGQNLLMPGKESEITWFLLHYGRWPVEQLPPEVVSGEVIAVEFRASPPERNNPGQLFEPIGNLSEMIAQQYNHVTAPSGKVEALSPTREPASFGVVIPPEFASDRVPIWRFVQKPPEPGDLATTA